MSLYAFIELSTSEHDKNGLKYKVTLVRF
jgi:hypothetical protein